MVRDIQAGDTLWGIAKESLQTKNEGQKVTNQQIIDEMNKIANANGYDSIDACANGEFCSKGGKFCSLKIPGLEVEKEEVVENEPVAEVEQAPKNTTLGANGTFYAKATVKGLPEVVKATDKGVKHLKGKVKEQKVQKARNAQAAKIKDARKAADNVTGLKKNLEAERAKLNSLKKSKASKETIEKQQKAVKAAQKRYIEANKSLKSKREAAGLDPKTGKQLKNKKIVKTPKGKAAKAGTKKDKKVQKARNAQAAKIKDARKAADNVTGLKKNLEAERAKLNSLKKSKASKETIEKQQKAVKAAQKRYIEANKSLKSKREAAGLDPKTGKALKKKVAKQVTKKGAKKAAAKTLAKAGGKTALKKIPGVGFIAGVVFAADRVAHGDIAGAVGEVVSGAVSCIPGAGTVASVVIDAGLMARDIRKA